MRRIERLPKDVHNSVRSGVVISDLARVVEELVFNSLEAGATKVSVAVGVCSSSVKVVDNGLGITRDELVLIGERYVTSKVGHMAVNYPDTESFDFHGEALCSISHISILEIMTKARGKPNGYKKIMKNCKCLFLGINDDLQDVGTTVSARDIFYNQPVRRKQMNFSPKKVLNSIRMSVLRIALVHLNVSFKVVDVEGTGELLHTRPTPSPLPILFNNFGIENSGDFHKLNVSDGLMKICGYITGPRDIFSPKALQYVYINSRFICKGPIHKLVNELATKFDLSNTLKPTSSFQSEKQNRCHMCPTFILNVNCPRSYYDIVTSERSGSSVEFKDWDLVLTFIENGVKLLWIKNISHDTPASCERGRKRCRKENSQTDLDLSSPQLKKPSKNFDRVHDWEKCLSPMGKPSTSSKLKNYQNEASYLTDNRSHLSRCNSFSPQHHQIVACTSSKQDIGISSAALVDMLPKFNVNTSTRNGVPADYPELCDDIPIDKDLKKSFLRNCSFQRSLLDRTPSDQGFGFGRDDLRLSKEWVNFDDNISDEGRVKQLLHGREKQIDVSPPFQFSPITKYDNRERAEFPSPVIRNGMSDSYSQWVNFDDSLSDEVKVKQVLCGREKYIDASPSFQFSPITQYNYRQRSEFPSVVIRNDMSDSCSEWVNFDESISDEVKVKKVFCGREKYIDVSSEFQLSPTTHYDNSEISDFPSPVIGNDMSDSYEQAKKMSSSQHYFAPVWSPVAEEKTTTTTQEEDDLVEYHPEFCEDTIQRYSSRREHEYHIESNLNTRGRWQQQNDLFFNFSPFPKVCTYPKRELGEFHWGDFESSLSPYPSKRPTQRDCASLPFYCEESPKSDSMPSWHDTTSTEAGCGSPTRRYQERMYIRKKRSIRSHSAPPFYKVKKRHLDIIYYAESSKNHAQLPAETYDPELFVQNQPSPKGKSVTDCSFAERPSLERSTEVFMVQNGKSQLKDQIINRNSMERSEPKDMKDSFDSGVKWRNCSFTADGTAPSINKDQDTILDISSSKLYLPGNSLVPTSIDKTSLEHAKVLDQVDKKFIAVVAGRALAVIDQHAADERVRLEELRHKVLSGELKKVTYLDDAKELVLPEIGYQLLHNYAEQVQSWGWICNIHSQNTSSFAKNLDFLHRQPSVIKLLAVPCILGVNLTDTDLLEFLQQLADTDGSATIPPSVHYILNNKACRGAIMFGDALLASECCLLVEELKKTSQCFQCAHGRPTTVPLVNLDVLHEKIDKLASHTSWHRLHHHRLKLERSFQRLNSALG